MQGAGAADGFTQIITKMHCRASLWGQRGNAIGSSAFPQPLLRTRGTFLDPYHHECTLRLYLMHSGRVDVVLWVAQVYFAASTDSPLRITHVTLRGKARGIQLSTPYLLR
jgi:hypothetical protein